MWQAVQSIWVWPAVSSSAWGLIVTLLPSTRARLPAVRAAREAASWQRAQASFPISGPVGSGACQALRMSSWAAANAWQASWQPKHRDGALEKPVQAEAAAVCASREWQGAHSCSGSQTHSSCKDTCSASAIPGISVGAAGGDWQLARPAAKHRKSAQVAPASARGLCFPLRRIGHACFLKRSCTSFMVPALKPSLKELGTTMRLLPPPSFTLSFTMLAMRIWSAISSWRYSSAAPT